MTPGGKSIQIGDRLLMSFRARHWRRFFGEEGSWNEVFEVEKGGATDWFFHHKWMFLVGRGQKAELRSLTTMLMFLTPSMAEDLGWELLKFFDGKRDRTTEDMLQIEFTGGGIYLRLFKEEGEVRILDLEEIRGVLMLMGVLTRLEA